MRTKFYFISFTLLLIGFLPLFATQYFLYPSTSTLDPWAASGKTGTKADANLSVTLNAYLGTDSVWMAAGIYPTSAAISLKNGQIIRGGFSGSETNISNRTLYDADGNGLVEPWEFYNATIITGSGFSGTSVGYSIISDTGSASYTLNGVSIDGHNTSNRYGGGIYTNSNSTITNCIIRNINHTGISGGAGVYSNASGGATISGCLIENCVTSASGGAIYANRKVTVKQCVIRNNYASTNGSSKGGGIYLGNTADASNTTNIVNNAIYNNTCEQQGGAIHIYASSAADDGSGPLNIVNNTIVNNIACTTTGGSTGGIIGMRIGTSESPGTLQKFYNNVIYNNFENGTTTVKNLRTTLTSGTVDLQYCAYNGGATTGTGGAFGTNGDINNLSTPNFVQPSTTKGYTATMPTDVKKANFAIRSNSALKDVGALSSTLSVVPTLDLMGNGRPDETAGDIGAYEYYAGITNLLYATDGSTITQNFDILAGLGTKTLYTNSSGSDVTTALGPWDLSDPIACYGKTELTGWQVYKTSGTTSNATSILIGGSTGGNGTLNFYYLGNPNSTGSDVALGSASGTAINSAIGVMLQNNTGKTLTSFTLSYTGEQWKKTATAQTLTFKYAIGTAASMKDISNGIYTAVSQLNFVTPNTDNTTTPDGNTAGFRTAKSYTVSGISWPNGQRLALRWDASTGQMAIDDVNFSATSLITLSTSVLSGLNYTYGSESSSESTMNVSGTGLSSGITLTPPNDFEISTTSGSGFTSSAITIGSGGTISPTPIYIRLKSGLTSGSYNLENIAVTSSGVGTQYISCSGTVSQKTLTISSAAVSNKVYDGTNVAVITGSLSGVVNSDDVTLNGTGTFASTGVGTDISVTSTSTLGGTKAGNYLLIQPTGLSGEIIAISSPINSDSNLGNAATLPGTDITVAAGKVLTVDNTAIVRSITVAAGGKLTLSAGLTATNGITLESNESGTATILQSGNLTGNVIARQYLGTARNWYVSSPVCAATSPATNITRYYEYVEAGTNGDFSVTGSTAYWKGLNTGNTMETGKGYIAQASAGATVSFSGTPNNGDIITTFDLTRNDAKGKGFNLVGNPYPSYIDWSLVATANPNLNKTFYFRSKNTNVTSTYTFVSYNGLLNTSVSSNGTANTTITRFIPPTQAFWVRVNSGTNATKMYFNNNMRAHCDDNGNLLKTPKLDSHTRLRLQLINGTESDETLICTESAADNGFDMYDSPKMMNNSSVTPDLYTLAGQERLVINGLNAISDNTELPLGFNLNAAATLKLKASEISNFADGTRIYLLDKTDNKQIELTPETEYSFSTTAATTNNESRFSLLFKVPGNTTGISNTEKSITKVFVNTQNQITIVAKPNSHYAIYNAVGQLIENGTLNSELGTTNYKLQTGVYVVIVNNQSTRVIVK